MSISELRILPPFAIGRLGSADTPLDNFSIVSGSEQSLGFRRIVPAETLQVSETTGEISGKTVPESIEFKMPESGTKLSKCLGFVASQYPKTVTTRDLCGISGQNTSDVSSQLIVLMHKGLVERVEARPGTKGGSIWLVTKRALEALSMEV